MVCGEGGRVRLGGGAMRKGRPGAEVERLDAAMRARKLEPVVACGE